MPDHTWSCQPSNVLEGLSRGIIFSHVAMWRIDLGVAREEEGGTLRRPERVVTWKQTEWGSILKGELIKLADELWLVMGEKEESKTTPWFLNPAAGCM